VRSFGRLVGTDDRGDPYAPFLVQLFWIFFGLP
jgi:hypothetical protein